MSTSSMFHKPAKLLAGGSLLVVALVAGQSAFAASIISSKHDLTAGSVRTSDTSAEPCAFCHTPHGASSSAQLWNRGAAATTTFTLYSSTTMDGTVAQPGANSVLCLSCHDGATALDLVINKPGSGGLNASGASAGYAGWTGTSGAGSNVMLSTSAAMLGTSLANDHPIGIPYCGGLSGSGCKDGDFVTAKLYLGGVAQSGPATTAGNWWVSTDGNTTREKTDLPLYGAVTGSVSPQVECATCHEPHTAAATGVSFLRIANTGSAMCVACHVK